MKILVTGCSGFVGRHLVQALQKLDGVQVFGIDREPLPVDVNFRGTEFLQYDIARASAHRWIAGNKFDIIYHLAAQAGVGNTDYLQQVDDNITATVHIAMACAESGSKLVFTSSGAVYTQFTTESGACAPEDTCVSGYGISKLTAENYIRIMSQKCGFPFTILRMGNIYGHQWKPKAVIGTWVSRLLRHETVVIHGDGAQERDFIHVSDIVRAMESCMEKGDNTVIDLCTGEGCSIMELWFMVEQIAKERGLTPSYIMNEHAHTGIKRSVLDQVTAYLCLGWKAQIELEDGLEALFREFDVDQRFTLLEKIS